MVVRANTCWWLPAIGLLWLLPAIIGCGSAATRKQFYEPLTAELRSGNYTSAAQRIEAAREAGKYRKKDRFIYYLEAGLAWHYASQYDSSNLRLADAERTAEELYTKSVSREILANTLLNDNIREYDGEDFEVLYTNLIMALNYLALGEFDEAFVEIRRANNKLDLLELKYVDQAEKIARQAQEDTSAVYVEYEAKKVRFNNSAFARYLSMHLYAADGLFDDARIDHDFLLDAFAGQPHVYSFEPPQVTYSDGSNSVLSIVGLVGLAPTKEALNLRLRTDEQLNLLTVIYTDKDDENAVFANYPLPDGIGDVYAKLSIPQFVPQRSQVAAVRVTVDTQSLGELQLIEDVTEVAHETFSAKQSVLLWRTVLRAVAKSFAAAKLKNKIDDGGLAGWLGKLAVDVIQDFSESADLRGSRLLPGRIYVGDFELRPGNHDIRIDFITADGHVVGSQVFYDIDVRPGRFNLLRTFCLQ